jgi:hypothetical protein
VGERELTAPYSRKIFPWNCNAKLRKEKKKETILGGKRNARVTNCKSSIVVLFGMPWNAK